MARFSSSETRSTSRDVEVGRLADQRDHFGLRVDQGPHAGIFFGPHAAAAGHAEGADQGVLQIELAHALEVLGVFLVREGITPFDEVEAQAVEPCRDQQLVLERKADALALAAVAQRGVVDLDAWHEDRGVEIRGERRVAQGL